MYGFVSLRIGGNTCVAVSGAWRKVDGLVPLRIGGNMCVVVSGAERHGLDPPCRRENNGGELHRYTCQSEVALARNVAIAIFSRKYAAFVRYSTML